MGIEKFFNSLKKSYGTKIITKIEKSTFFPDQYLLVDFNSIVHNISQSLSTSIVYLYHMYLVSNIYPEIFKRQKSKFISHLQNISTDETFILESDINLPDITSDTTSNKFSKSINFNKLTIDDIDGSFFRIFNETNLDKLVINKVGSYIVDLTKYFPSLTYLYLAIDGVPLYAKMVEQRKRRFIGLMMDEIKLKVLESYKNDLNIDPNIDKYPDIYYNHYEFEKKIKNFKFNKSKISPGTLFMSNLEEYLTKYLINKLKRINIVIDSYNSPGEGEKKIVFKIHQLHKNGNLGKISVYSPDADVILLMLLELDKCNIQIIRFDQQLLQLDVIDIVQLKDIIIEYMRYNIFSKQLQYNIIKDIVMLFTILGNDFLPKLEIINTNKHIRTIFDAYLSLNKNITRNEEIKYMLIFPFNKTLGKYEVKLEMLSRFFIELNKRLRSDEYTRNQKEWKLEPDQIVNSNAIKYYQHIFNIENLTNIYEPTISEIVIIDNRYIMKYIQGFVWLTEYYLNHDTKYKFFYYKYKKSPTIQQLINIIMKKPLMNKIMNNLNKTIITDSEYFKPSQQLIYISYSNINNIIDPKLITPQIKEIADLYNRTYNPEINLVMDNYKLNIFDYLNCSGAYYLSKCEMKSQIYVSGRKYLDFLNGRT